ncbi:MAG: hypothetical protein JO353_11525 [Phycisphaerae bacterium]|nr:hypothetical protein [Phycisphaerae bacterium]
MHSLRFNHVFLALLIFCGLTAFLLPRFADPARAPFQNIFFPISRPVRLLVDWARLRFDHHADANWTTAQRTDDDIRKENVELHAQVASLTAQVEKLQEREDQRAKLGPLRNLCTPFNIIGGDAGTSESLVIGGSTLDHLRAKMPVVYLGGLVGQLDQPGLVGTRLRLITDRGFALTGVFNRFRNRHEQFLARGIGSNTLLIDALPMDRAKQIAVNDWLVLDDNDWPTVVQGQPIGRVISEPTASRHSPGYAEVRLQPASNLMQLREVMVVTQAMKEQR